MAAIEIYNKAWAKAYKREAKALKKALSDAKIKTYHVGATAVKRMVSRPVIDIMVIVRDISALSQEAMEKLGYNPISVPFGVGAAYEKQENGISYRALVYKASDKKAIATHLAVKAYLTENKRARKEYSEAKLKLSGNENYDEAIQEYKSAFIARVMKENATMKSRTLYIPTGTAAGLVVGALIGALTDGAIIGGAIGVIAGAVLGFIASIVMSKLAKKKLD